MVDYIEIKRVFCEILGIQNETEISEESDIVVKINKRNMPFGYHHKEEHENVLIEDKESEIIIDNTKLIEAFNSLSKRQINEMQLYSETCYEVAVLSDAWIRNQKIELEDSVNEINYCLGYASLEYILMICSKLCDNDDVKSDAIGSIRYYGRIIARDDVPADDFIKKYFRIKTIKIDSKKSLQLKSFEQYCNSFEYLYMYKTRQALYKILYLNDLFDRNSGGYKRIRGMDEPPRRTVNSETLEYYAMAIGADDPFTKYISFYHVLEYYFDEVYKKKLVDEMKNKLTNPGFSYKNEKMIYDLAKWVGKKMKNDDEDGRGNELDSLKYLLEEYVSIEDLIDELESWNADLKSYYQTQNVSFAGSKKDKIAWTDKEGVYTNISNRIYYTRNALVHSKSGQADKQYRPQKHKDKLVKEIPLIQVIAELVLFKDGEAL